MNKWQQIWNKRKDDFENIDVKNPRAVFAELIRLDGYDSAGITSELLSYFEHQYGDLKAALKCIGGGVYLKSVAAQELGSIFLLATVTQSADWIIHRH